MQCHFDSRIMELQTITIKFFGLSTVDVADVADALSEHFWEVDIRKQPSPPAASPLGFEDAVVLLALSIVAHGFFNELGKDIYKGLRQAIANVAKKAVGPRNNRGGITIGFRVDRPHSYVLFAYLLPPTEKELQITLPQIPTLVDRTHSEVFACYVYDEQKGSWGQPTFLTPAEADILRARTL